ncbi:MAG TPA: ATP-binding protein [Steroidobacteraceae bacterium]|nr:ATP-binding protein [Steroidobacteraceae bacterium]
MRLTPWPRSLFGRLIAASVLAVLLAELTAFVLIARERENFVLQGNVREWSRRIAEITFMLQPLSASEREAAVTRLIEQPRRFVRSIMGGGLFRPRVSAADELQRRLPDESERRLPDERPPDGPPPVGLGPPDDPPMNGPPVGPRQSFSSQVVYVPLPLSSDFEPILRQQLQSVLGSAYRVSIGPTRDAARRAIPIVTPFFEPRDATALQLYDVDIGFPDGDSAAFRLAQMPRGAPLPRNLFANLVLLVVVLVIALYVTARSITRPLSNLVSAAEGLGRNVRQPKLEEKGARELRDAARAFNTMQDRLQRYLDSRTRVLAAMSHDLKTPLTRLRLQVETTLDDAAIQARFSKELDEMESMVRGALALFRGLDDDESLEPIDINALLARIATEFTEMGADVSVEGRALLPFTGKPQALKRCLTNLVGNAVKFGTRAKLVVEDGTALVIRVRDDGPGIPQEELERVFEPFYRLESSRNRDTGGTGLGLSIARDVAQAHGGSLIAQNRPGGGLEALLVLPRQR